MILNLSVVNPHRLPRDIWCYAGTFLIVKPGQWGCVTGLLWAEARLLLTLLKITKQPLPQNPPAPDISSTQPEGAWVPSTPQST